MINKSIKKLFKNDKVSHFINLKKGLLKLNLNFIINL